MIRTSCGKIVICALVALFSPPASGWSQYTSSPIDAAYLTTEPYQFTGIAMSERIPCSGAVVVDTRLLLSASHCVFNREIPADQNAWRATPEWFPRYHAATLPVEGSGFPTRGYWFFTSYADTVRSTSINSPQSFDLDFYTAFAFESLSEAASGYWIDGYQGFMSQTWKQTVGYPSSNYPASHPHKYLMHHNGPWTATCQTLQNSYVLCDEVSTGPGNSGGPVFVMNSADSKFYYAGTLVSGWTRKNGDPTDVSGVNLMTADEWKVINAAKEAALKGSGNTTPPSDTPTPTPTPSFSAGGQRLGIYGNAVPIPSGKSYTNRADMTEFGSITGRRSLTRTFALRNYGTSELHFSAGQPVRLTGRSSRYFRLVNSLPVALQAQETYPLRISFRSSPRGTHRAVVSVRSDDPQTPLYSFTISARRR